MPSGPSDAGAKVFQSVVKELGTINRANGFFTDVRTAFAPNYSFESDMVNAAESASLQVWIVDDGPAPAELQQMGMNTQMMNLIIGGVLKQDRDLQVESILFNADVVALMTANPSRIYPGSAALGSAVATDYAGTSYEVDKAEATQAVGWFLSRWRVIYDAPFAV